MAEAVTTVETTPSVLTTETIVTEVLATIDREREREIVARRFGLFDRRETLEQIGEMLGITRERVRQLEKSVLTRLKTTAAQGSVPHITEFQQRLTALLQPAGNVARVSKLTGEISETSSREEQARVAFLAQLCPSLVVITEDDSFHNSVGIKRVRDEKDLKSAVAKLVASIKELGEPKSIEEISVATDIEDPIETAALASTSKLLATLNGRWGLIKWPMVNEIADAIKDSDFKRKDVTTQAIHNELIKDKRFVLIGRGIYALKEWGYEKGTVADIITEVLKDAGEPLHRDEIVKRVLASRFVKETTILLNLQGKPQFKRVAKATYQLAE